MTDADVDARAVRPACAAWGRAAEWLLAVAVAGLVFVQFSNTTQHLDELYHVLAAKSLLADGDLLIGETGRPYSRARGYTYAVAASFHLFGEGLWQSRLPSLLAGLVLAGVLFGWARWRFGRLSAWVGLGLMLQMPILVYTSGLCRFYMVQAAATAVLLASVDVAMDRAVRMRFRALAVVSLVVAAAVALHVQVSSVFPIGLALGGAALWQAWRWPCDRLADPRRRAAAIAAVSLALGLALLAGLLWFEPMRSKWADYRLAVSWASDTRSDPWYYLDYLWFWHHWLILLFVPAAVVACLRWRWRAGWVVAFFAVGLLAHSFGGMKAPRYLLWAYPFLALTLGMGFSGLEWWLTRRRGTPPTPGPPPIRAAVIAAGVVLLAFMLTRTLGPHQVRRMWSGEHHAYVYPDWRGVATVVAGDSAGAGGIVVGSADVKALDALGRCDYSLSQTRTEGRDEFALDWRTGIPVVYSAQSVARIVREHAAGLVIVEAGHWRRPWGVPDDTADWIEANLTPVPVDPVMQLLVFRWDRREPVDASAAELLPGVTPQARVANAATTP